jgi:hypothetical protein
LLAKQLESGIILPSSAALFNVQRNPHVIKVNMTLCVEGSPMDLMRTAEESREEG